MNSLFLSFVSMNWKKLLIPIAVISAIFIYLFFPREQTDKNVFVINELNPFPELIEEVTSENSNEEMAPNIILVDIKGAIRHPGVYTMQEGDRIIDVIYAAGGYLSGANSNMLNHAMKIFDEQLIYVPLEGEEMSLSDSLNQSLNTSTEIDDGRVNINTASLEQLTTIPGIGPAKATAILKYREEFGTFQSIQDLMKISGIGQKTFNNLEDNVKVK